ncbi:MAG: hypothetical protein IKJ24_04820 [Clostridia bacterium]|nr:hypothetical protein [Clostridia bacterium]
MKVFNSELIEKAKAAKTAEELMEIVQESGVEMTADEATSCFAQLNTKQGEILDDDLENVVGGGCGDSDSKEDAPSFVCRMCGSQNPPKRVYLETLGYGRRCSDCGNYYEFDGNT